MTNRDQNFLIKLFPNISSAQKDQLSSYADLLKQHNEHINLISRKDIENIWENHILHSLVVLKYFDIPQEALFIDVGSGAGLPGIPIKIVRPDLSGVLVDSVRKKTLFLKKVTSQLNLPKITVLNFRLEKNANTYNLFGKFDVVFTRAIAGLRKTIPIVKPLVKPTGYYIAWKGVDDASQIEQIADEFNLTYQVFLIEDKYYGYSERIDTLRLIRIHFNDIRNS